jgi:acetyl/propionyl-CoA carboxylase alpha subunit
VAGPVTRVLVANRGEIARRIMRTCHDLGLSTVAVYADPDRRAPHVGDADLAVALGGSTPAESYLDTAKLLAAARATGADAVHPGYGFLAEDPVFAAACADAGLTWIGPPPQVIRVMASKIEAKRIAAGAGAPLLPSATLDADDPDGWRQAADRVGYPLLVKASAGGGGKGMHAVSEPKALVESIRTARREAGSAFGDPAVFLERALDRPRHIEVQVLGDEHGNLVHLFDRDCSVQRRHQKVIEEAPAPALSDAARSRLHEAALAVARAVAYTNAGTVEFLASGDDVYFLEVNTRLQVEHPVTEAVSGLDLVRLQIAVARGERLPFGQSDVRASGHAIEARVYAEDPSREFLPSTGRLARFEPGAGDGLRWDTGVTSGSDVSPFYDPLLAKVVSVGADRREAAGRLGRGLRRAEIHGLITNRDALVAVLEHEAFLAGDIHTAFFDDHPAVLDAGPPEPVRRDHAVAATLALRRRRARASTLPPVAPPGWRNLPSAPATQMLTDERGRGLSVAYGPPDGAGLAVSVDGVALEAVAVTVDDDAVDLEVAGVRARYRVHASGDRVWVNGAGWQTSWTEPERFPTTGADAAHHGPTAPVPGTVVLVEAEPGHHVRAGELLVVLEAMKMEHRITADAPGTVTRVLVAPGDRVDAHQLLVEIEPDGP